MSKQIPLGNFEEKTPIHKIVNGLDLVVIRYGDEISMLYGRCLHRGALMADGYIEGNNIICGLHGWDYRFNSGVSEYNNSEVLHKFNAKVIDGRGGGTGSAPSILRNNINVPTIPALARARKHLDKKNASDVSLIITGGLRVAEDFAKALMLGANAIAVSNSALQAIGCLGMRACSSNSCPVGIATQKENLRQRLIIKSSAKR